MEGRRGQVIFIFSPAPMEALGDEASSFLLLFPESMEGLRDQVSFFLRR
jgi:hypothetical protein